jgi:hypothetical protein
MRVFLFRQSIALITLFAFVVPAFSWHDEGHKLTGYIAWQRMTQQTRDNVIRILRAAPEDSQIATFYPIYGIMPEDLKRMEYFYIVPTWADMIRERSFPVRYRKYHHSNWHYDDTFWREVNGKVELVNMNDEGGLALQQLAWADKTMRDPRSSDADKAVAIAWFMHIAGDIHQPLHNSARVTDTEPKGDQGGNLFFIEAGNVGNSSRKNLHWYWDGITAQSVPLKKGQFPESYIESIGEKIVKKHPYTEFASILNLGNYDGWHQEGFKLATTEVFTPDLMRNVMPSKKYQKRAWTISQRQIALAGYRIADTLNAIFGGAVAPATPN